MYYVGVDIGGTNVKAGIIDETGKIVVKSSIPTDSDKDYKKITGDVAAQIRALADSAKIDWQEVAGVGIGCPGIITSETGVVDYTCNLGWRRLPPNLPRVLISPLLSATTPMSRRWEKPCSGREKITAT